MRGRWSSARAAYISVAPTPLVLDLTPAVAGAAAADADWSAPASSRGRRPSRRRTSTPPPTTGSHLVRRADGARSPRPPGGPAERTRRTQADALHDVELTVNGGGTMRGAGPPAAVRLPAPRPAAHRHPRRVRARRLRRLHGAGRRRAGALLPDARREGRRATRSRRSRARRRRTTCTRCSRRSASATACSAASARRASSPLSPRYIEDNPRPTEDEAREAISGNLCRCTGYQNIVASVLRAAEIARERAKPRNDDETVR